MESTVPAAETSVPVHAIREAGILRGDQAQVTATQRWQREHGIPIAVQLAELTAFGRARGSLLLDIVVIIAAARRDRSERRTDLGELCQLCVPHRQQLPFVLPPLPTLSRRRDFANDAV